MAEQAKVTSLHALESFRADLIVFISEAHRAVDEVGDEVRRTRYWIQKQRRGCRREINTRKCIGLYRPRDPRDL